MVEIRGGDINFSLWDLEDSAEVWSALRQISDLIRNEAASILMGELDRTVSLYLGDDGKVPEIRASVLAGQRVWAMGLGDLLNEWIGGAEEMCREGGKDVFLATLSVLETAVEQLRQIRDKTL